MDSPGRSFEQNPAEGHPNVEDQSTNNLTVAQPTSVDTVVDAVTRRDEQTVGVFTLSDNGDSDASVDGVKDATAQANLRTLGDTPLGNDSLGAALLGDDIIASQNDPESLSAAPENSNTINNDLAEPQPRVSGSHNLTELNTNNEAPAGEESNTETAELGGSFRRVPRTTNLTQLASLGDSQLRGQFSNNTIAVASSSNFTNSAGTSVSLTVDSNGSTANITDSSAITDSPPVNGNGSIPNLTDITATAGSDTVDGNDPIPNITDSTATTGSGTVNSNRSAPNNTNTAVIADPQTVDGNSLTSNITDSAPVTGSSATDGNTSTSSATLQAIQQTWSFGNLTIGDDDQTENIQHTSPALGLASVFETGTAAPAPDQTSQTQHNIEIASSFVGAPSTQTQGPAQNSATHGLPPLDDSDDEDNTAPETPTRASGRIRPTLPSLASLNLADRLRNVRNYQADARVRRASENLDARFERTLHGGDPDTQPDLTSDSTYTPSVLETIPESSSSGEEFFTPPETPPRRLRRVQRSPSLRSLANSPNPILGSPLRRAETWSPEPEEDEDDEEDEEEEEELGLILFGEFAGFAPLPPPVAEEEDAAAAAANEWHAPDDHYEVEEEDEDDEVVENLNFEGIPADAPGVQRLRAAVGHLEDVRGEIDDLDGDLPAGNFAPGNPAAVRARLGLLFMEEETSGAFREVWEALNFEREVAGAARQGLRHYQEEARRLAVALEEARVEADVAREAALSNAVSLEEARLELALLRRLTGL